MKEDSRLIQETEEIKIEIQDSGPSFEQIEPFTRKDVPITCYEYSKVNSQTKIR